MKRIPLILLALALAVRITYFVVHPGQEYRREAIYQSDGILYDALARSVLHGDGLAIDKVLSARTSPLYPLFMAGVFAVFGHNFVWIRLMQILLATAGCFFLWLSAREIMEHGHANLVLFLAAFYYPFIQTPSYILTETLFLFCLLLTFLFIVRTTNRRHRTDAVLLGLAGGLTALARPPGLIFVMLALTALLLAGMRNRRRFMLFCIAATAFVLVLAPWITRNYLRFHAFIPATSMGGAALYLGNNPQATGGHGGWHNYGEDTVAGMPPETAAMSELETSRYLNGMATGYIRAHPLRFFSLCGKKFLNLWRPFYSGGNIWYRVAMVIEDMLILYPFGILGFILLWRNRPAMRYLLTLMLLFVLVYTAVVITSIAVVRYRYPLMPFFIICASYGLGCTFAAIKQRRARKCCV